MRMKLYFTIKSKTGTFLHKNTTLSHKTDLCLDFYVMIMTRFYSHDIKT